MLSVSSDQGLRWAQVVYHSGGYGLFLSNPMGEAVAWIFRKDTLTVERQLQIVAALVAALCISETCMNYLELLDPSKILISSCLLL